MRKISLYIFLTCLHILAAAQENLLVVTDSLIKNDIIHLGDREGWHFHPGDDPALAFDSTFSGAWSPVSLAMRPGQVPDEWDGIGWFAGVIRIDSSMHNKEVALWGRIYGAMEIYVNGERAGSAGRVGTDYKTEEPIGQYEPITFSFGESDLHFIAIRYSNHNYQKAWDKAPSGPLLRLGLTETSLNQYRSFVNETRIKRETSYFLVGILLAFAFLHFILFFQYPAEKANLAFSLLLLSYVLLSGATLSLGLTVNPDLFTRFLIIEGVAAALVGITNIYFVFIVTRRKINWIPVSFTISGIALIYFVFTNPFQSRPLIVPFIYLSTIAAIILFSFDSFAKKLKEYNVIIFTLVIYFIIIIPRTLFISFDISVLWFENENLTRLGFIFIPIGYSIYLAKNIASTNHRLKNQLEENERLASEKQRMIESKKEELEKEVLARTAELNKSYELLKDSMEKLTATQDQLVQQEKLASLGELTAGIAHEIQNPLNFVNNFSEVNKDLLVELKDEIKNGNFKEVEAIADDVISNEEKINHHGKRADAIVKGMLQHSRTSSGQKEPTDINALCDEYLRLAYHGLKAKDPQGAAHPSFNASFHFEADKTLPMVNVVPQDIGRVLLNLINNAFQACGNADFRMLIADFNPMVTVSTKNLGDKIQIRVKDNGPGIPDSIQDKIFQPFFTTKPTGQGTGLGLSLSYDIVKAHGGELKVETKEGEGSVFIIILPDNTI
jgi:two-component system, NtrC family, sensor kinase